MSTPNHRRHFGALGATASGIKVSSGGRELLPGIDSGTTLSLGGLAFLEQKLKNSTETLGDAEIGEPGDESSPVKIRILEAAAGGTRRREIRVFDVAT